MPNRLGLAFVAGKLVVGTDLSIKAIQNKEAKVVILANDASFNTVKKVTDKAKFYNIPVNNKFDSITISKAIGKKNIKTIVITEQGFANMYK